MLNGEEGEPLVSDPVDQPVAGGRGPSPFRSWLGQVGNQILVAVVVAIVAPAVVGGIVYLTRPEPTPRPDPTTTTTPPTPQTTSVPTTAPIGLTTTESTPPASDAPGTARLGRDVVPTATEPCHVPGSASGAAWQLTTVHIGGRAEQGYVCNLLASTTGSLDFQLSRAYQTLQLTIAMSDESASTSGLVKFEIISDGTTYLAKPATLKFGEHVDLTVDVHATSRLQLRVTEVSGNDGGAALRPTWASAVLTRNP